MYQFDITNDELKEAKWASLKVGQHLSGIKLDEGLRIGAALMRGRQIAMKAAGVNAPIGKSYAEALFQWKRLVRYPEGREAEDYFSVAIVCAEHRTIADDIIAGLSGKQRADMGMFGLSKRVRAKVKEFEEGPKPPKDKPKSAVQVLREEVETLEERLAKVEPKSTSDLVGLLVRRDPAELLEVARLHDPAWFDRFVLAVRNDTEWEAGDDDDAYPAHEEIADLREMVKLLEGGKEQARGMIKILLDTIKKLNPTLGEQMASTSAPFTDEPVDEEPEPEPPLPGKDEPVEDSDEDTGDDEESRPAPVAVDPTPVEPTAPVNEPDPVEPIEQ